MAFQKFQKSEYPRRQWLIEGEPDTGKSTFVTQLYAPQLIIDADHRYGEVMDLVGGDVFQLSGDPLDNIDPDRIARLINQGIRGSGVKSIVVDSLTPIIAPLVTRAFRDNAAGENRNKVAAYAEKATAMRLLQDTLTGTGCDVAWIYHVYQGRDARAQVQERTSITTLELSRVLRSCNLRLRVQKNGNVFSVHVVWARRGRSDMTITDTSGHWENMPERIEEAVYGGLSEAEQDEIEGAAPATFPSPAEAIRWGMDQAANGQAVFRDEAHAQNAYELVKHAKNVTTAAEMRDAWVAEVRARQEGGSTVTAEERES